jgi:hypothetical protein
MFFPGSKRLSSPPLIAIKSLAMTTESPQEQEQEQEQEQKLKPNSSGHNVKFQKGTDFNEHKAKPNPTPKLHPGRLNQNSHTTILSATLERGLGSTNLLELPDTKNENIELGDNDEPLIFPKPTLAPRPPIQPEPEPEETCCCTIS